MKIIKNVFNNLNENFPKLIQVIDAIKRRNFNLYTKPKELRFSKIFIENFWGSNESISGEGSILDQTITIRKEIPILLEKMNVKSILDIPCGDFNWMKELTLKIEKFIGGDIVPELIAQNRKKFENDIYTFKILDIIRSKLPKVDMIFCRDCLVHLSFKDCLSAIQNFKASKSKYLLITTFTKKTKNKNIYTGGWRPLNLQLNPFNFPKAIKIINEKCTQADGKFYDKSLGLWKIEDILN